LAVDHGAFQLPFDLSRLDLASEDASDGAFDRALESVFKPIEQVHGNGPLGEWSNPGEIARMAL
jgi:hypothetical protein